MLLFRGRVEEPKKIIHSAFELSESRPLNIATCQDDIRMEMSLHSINRVMAFEVLYTVICKNENEL